MYVDVFGTPSEADRLRKEVDVIMARVRVDAAHALPAWSGDASTIQGFESRVPSWHHIAEDSAAGVDEQWAGEIMCRWQLRAG